MIKRSILHDLVFIIIFHLLLTIPSFYISIILQDFFKLTLNHSKLFRVCQIFYYIALYLLKALMSGMMGLFQQVKNLTSKFTQEQLLSSEVLFEDENIKIREKVVTLKNYYLPIWTSRRIPIDQISEVQLVDAYFSNHIWGFTMINDNLCWVSDSKRINGKELIIITTTDPLEKVRPAFTCSENIKAFNLISILVQKAKKQKELENSSQKL